MNERMDEQTGELISVPVSQEVVSPVVAAEINQQVATAHRFPRRSLSMISDEIRALATLNDDIAAECVYSLSRSDKKIVGPSIRFAEIVRGAYGNLRIAARFVRLDTDDPNNAAVIVEAVALDLQNNSAEIIPVRRSVMTSGKGGKIARMYNADMINTTVNAATSIARRNAILTIVSKAIWSTGYQRAVEVTRGTKETFGSRKEKILEAFGKYGVTPAQVFEAIDVKDARDMTVDHMPALFGLLNALKDGESPTTLFAKEFKPVQNPLNDHKDTANGNGPAKPAESAADAPTADQVATPAQEEKTAPVAVSGGMSNGDYVDMALRFIENMDSKEGLKFWWKKGSENRTARDLTTEQFKTLTDAYESKINELGGKK